MKTAADRVPETGQLLLWVQVKKRKGGPPLKPVWYMLRSSWNMQVIGEEGVLHNVLPSWLIYPDSLTEWLKALPTSPPLGLRAVLEVPARISRELQQEFGDLPPEVRAQLSKEFREKYNL